MEDRICGVNAVAALFARRFEAVQRLFYTEERRHDAGTFCARLARVHRPYRMVPEDELARASGTVHNGGICAVATAREVPLLDAAAPPQHRFLVALDGVGNPHNLGAIARSAAFFGVRAMLLHDLPGAAMPSDAAYRVAEGGLEHLDLYRTGNLARAVRSLQPWYRSVAAALGPEGVPPRDIPLDRPTLLVIGEEGRGVGADVLTACRRQVRLTPRGAVQSLNIAQDAAVLLYALTR